MNEEDDFLSMFNDSLRNREGRYQILEHRVPVEVQIEYFIYSNHIRRGTHEINEDDYKRFTERLESADSSTKEKKKILSMLATSKEIRAFRLLERYAQQAEKELENWAYMALMESRIMVESELTDERRIFISSGLGGKEGKLRFYVLILAAHGVSFVDYQRKIIEKECEYLFHLHDCEIERLTIKDRYAELVILTPFISQINNLLGKVIGECNQYGNFLSDTVTVTNVKELDNEDIKSILERYENE